LACDEGNSSDFKNEIERSTSIDYSREHVTSSGCSSNEFAHLTSWFEHQWEIWGNLLKQGSSSVASDASIPR